MFLIRPARSGFRENWRRGFAFVVGFTLVYGWATMPQAQAGFWWNETEISGKSKEAAAPWQDLSRVELEGSHSKTEKDLTKGQSQENAKKVVDPAAPWRSLDRALENPSKAANRAAYYVATTGLDTRTPAEAQNPGTPWKTITRALGEPALLSGDVINVAAGLYDTANGEIFPLPFVDGVAVIGAGAGTTTISAPPIDYLFYHDGTTPLSPSTRLSGFTLAFDSLASIDDMVVFALDTTALAPQIDHNVFASSGAGNVQVGVWVYDNNTGDGSFTGTIDNNTFTDLYEGIALSAFEGGTGDNQSPVISSNTFTACDYGVVVSAHSSGNGLMAPNISLNTATGTLRDDIWIGFYPTNSTDLQVTPNIDNNEFTNTTRHNVHVDSYPYGFDGDVTCSPTVNNNTFTTPGDDSIHMYFSYFGGSSSTNVLTLSPTVTNNTITMPGGDGVYFSAYYWTSSSAKYVNNLTVSGNTITDAGSYGINAYIDFYSSYCSYVYGFDAIWTISNNTITRPTDYGIYYYVTEMDDMSYLTTTGTWDVTVAGNTVTDGSDYGIAAYPAYSWFDSPINQTALFQNNTVTGCTGDGLWISCSDQTGLVSNDVQVTGNVLLNNGGNGLYVESDDWFESTYFTGNAYLVSGNIIIGNALDGIHQYDGNDPPADFGGGNLSSPGNNCVFSNGDGVTTFDFYNGDENGVSAENNWWGTTNTVDIDGNIYDFSDDGTKGVVDYDPYLMAPTCAGCAGDDCVLAIATGPVNTYQAQGTNCCFADDYDLNACVGSATPGPDIVYTFNVQSAGTATFTYTHFGGQTGNAMAVVTDCGNIASCAAGARDSDDGMTDGVVTLASVPLVVGPAYYLILDTPLADACDVFVLDIDSSVPLPVQLMSIEIVQAQQPADPIRESKKQMEPSGSVFDHGALMARRSNPSNPFTFLSPKGPRAPYGYFHHPLFDGDQSPGDVAKSSFVPRSGKGLKKNSAKEEKEMRVSKVALAGKSGDDIRLVLEDGTDLAVPRARIDVRRGQVNGQKPKPPPKGSRAKLSVEERKARRIQKRADLATRVRPKLKDLKAGTPVLVDIKRGTGGEIKRVIARIFETEALAETERARKLARQQERRRDGPGKRKKKKAGN